MADTSFLFYIRDPFSLSWLLKEDASRLRNTVNMTKKDPFQKAFIVLQHYCIEAALHELAFRIEAKPLETFPCLLEKLPA